MANEPADALGLPLGRGRWTSKFHKSGEKVPREKLGRMPSVLWSVLSAFVCLKCLLRPGQVVTCPKLGHRLLHNIATLPGQGEHRVRPTQGCSALGGGSVVSTWGTRVVSAWSFMKQVG
jgi:hypothetical protein